MRSDSNFVVDTMVKAGFDEAPLRAVASIAETFIDEAEKIRNSAEYTAVGRGAAIGRLRTKAVDALRPLRSKSSGVRVAAEAKREEALRSWGGKVDDADVRETRALARLLEPLEIRGRLSSAVARKDVVFVRALQSTLGTEFPLVDESDFAYVREEMIGDALDESTKTSLANAEAVDAVASSVVTEIGA